MTPRLATRLAASTVGGAMLVALAIANAAGYRFGVSDQAFYLPSILYAGDHALYPRDATLLQAQGRLMVSDELTAWVVAHTGVSIEAIFLAGHLASLALLFTAVWLLARRFAASRWTAAAACLAVTLRHRITETGANTFEGYYHPRGLAFACGALGAAAMARDRVGTAWGLVALATVLHPTTGVWWAVWLVAATFVVRPRWRRQVAAATMASAALAGAVLLFTSMGARLRVMDAAWILPFASKDYVFPNAWPLDAWVANLILPVVVVAVWRWRVREGRAAPWEAGMAAGVVVLTATFLLSLPFIASHVALAVQLQTSRVFWVIDLCAVVSLTWALGEARWRTPAADVPSRTRAWRPAALAALLFAVSTARGIYIMEVQHPERRFVQVALANTDWVRVGRWLATRSPVGSYVLADPDHDWKFGHSVRLTAQRDVLVEGVKDAAVSLYDRDVATRVQARLEAVGDFASMDAPRARALAQQFDLDLLVIDRDLPLPEVHRDGRFRVYRLQ
ncbi:hypothetical protein [Luteitalea sp.]